ncbi:hypothetical protein Tco_0504379, partial [Tanacetum coccineum]
MLRDSPCCSRDIFKSVSTAVRFKTSRESSVDGTAGIVT